MDSTDDKDQKFPAGFEHVEERLNDATEHVKKIDDQIRDIPKEEGPRLVYRPPHFVGQIVPGSRDKTRIALQEKQHEIKMDALSQTEAETRNADGKSGRVVRDEARERLFPNPYRQVTQEIRLDDRHEPKDIEQSQDYMDAELVAKAAERKAVSKDAETTPENKNKDSMSMAARFSMSLSYTKASEKTERTPSRDREPDKDRD